jgi:hypothetical protein
MIINLSIAYTAKSKNVQSQKAIHIATTAGSSLANKLKTWIRVIKKDMGSVW